MNRLAKFPGLDSFRKPAEKLPGVVAVLLGDAVVVNSSEVHAEPRDGHSGSGIGAVPDISIEKNSTSKWDLRGKTSPEIEESFELRIDRFRSSDDARFVPNLKRLKLNGEGAVLSLIIKEKFLPSLSPKEQKKSRGVVFVAILERGPKGNFFITSGLLGHGSKLSVAMQSCEAKRVSGVNAANDSFACSNDEIPSGQISIAGGKTAAFDFSEELGVHVTESVETDNTPEVGLHSTETVRFKLPGEFGVVTAKFGFREIVKPGEIVGVPNAIENNVPDVFKGFAYGSKVASPEVKSRTLKEHGDLMVAKRATGPRTTVLQHCPAQFRKELRLTTGPLPDRDGQRKPKRLSGVVRLHRGARNDPQSG